MTTKRKLREFDRSQIVAVAALNDAGEMHEIRNVPADRGSFEIRLMVHADVELTQVSETEWECGTLSVLTLRPLQRVDMSIPAEFADFCEEHGVSPAQVFAGLVGDLCGINRPDMIFNSHGSDERDLARRWFDRVCWPQ